jgi:hypothetical protein
MNEHDVVSIGSFLVREPLFQGLTRDEYRWVADRCKIVSFTQGSVILEEGTEADAFYIVYSGKVSKFFVEENEEEVVSILSLGEHFGDDTLIKGDEEPYTVRAQEDVKVLKIDEDDFYEILDEFPQIEKRLKTTSKSREATERYTTGWLHPDEVIQFAVRRHFFFLLRALILPSLFLGISLAVSLYFYLIGNENIEWMLYLSLLLSFGGFLWLIWRTLDWRNDYFLVTNERVVHLEKVIAFYDSRVEAPLSSIIAVDVLRSFFGQIFDYGDVSVRSYMGNIVMNGVNQPRQFATVVNSYKNKVIQIDQERNQEQVNKALQEGLVRKKQEPTWDTLSFPEQAASPAPKTILKRDLAKSANTLLRMRWEDGGTVTYRRHWYILAGKIWWQIIAILLMSWLEAWLVSQDFQRNIACAAGGIVVLVLFGIMVYRTWDWINDIFQLTDTQIIDIDKKPLGAEGKKTANLDSPDFRIEHVRPSFIANVLNFGNVVVYIGQTPFNIEGVYNPDQVHQEVAMRRFTLLHKKRQSEEKTSQERMLDWFSAYRDLVEENGQDLSPEEDESENRNA